MKVSSRPFRAKEYGKCPIKNGVRGEHHTINKGDLIVRISPGVKWTEKRASIGMYSKCFDVQCSTDYAHVECLEKLNRASNECVRCGGTGLVDIGAPDAQGHFIEIACECQAKGE